MLDEKGPKLKTQEELRAEFDKLEDKIDGLSYFAHTIGRINPDSFNNLESFHADIVLAVQRGGKLEEALQKAKGVFGLMKQLALRSGMKESDMTEEKLLLYHKMDTEERKNTYVGRGKTEDDLLKDGLKKEYEN